MGVLTTKISDTVIEFTECADFAHTGKEAPYVDAYLVIGTKRAAVIDCLQTAAGLYEEVRKYTDLPVDLLITHGHGDHAGASLHEFADAGCGVYMSLKDYEPLYDMNPNVRKEWFTNLTDGMKFDLGGYVLETITCAGHTEGSVVFLDREHQLLFSGDTVGSGSFWMQIPTAIPLSRFKPNVERLYNITKEYKELLVYPGHRNQSPVQLTGQYVKDAYIVTSRVINGTLVGEDKVLDMPGRHMEYKSAAHGMMLDFCYSPDKIFFAGSSPEVKAAQDKFEAMTFKSGSLQRLL